MGCAYQRLCRIGPPELSPEGCVNKPFGCPEFIKILLVPSFSTQAPPSASSTNGLGLTHKLTCQNPASAPIIERLLVAL